MAKINKWFTPGIKLIPLDADPDSLEDGDVWVTTSAHASGADMFAYIDGTITSLTAGGGGGGGGPGPQPGLAGYFVGGAGYVVSPIVDNVDKILFSTEAVAVSTALPNEKGRGGAGTSSGTFGYYSGGKDVAAANDNTTDRIDFSDDSTSTIAATLATSTFDQGGTQSSTKSYIVGGSGSSTIEALTFATETIATLGSALPVVRRTMANWEDYANNAGYNVGGDTSGTDLSSINKLNTVTETNADIGGTLTAGKDCMDNSCISSTDGYLLGGDKGGTPGPGTEIEKMPFSTETPALIAATLNNNSGYSAGCVQSPTKGYNSRGSDHNAAAVFTDIEDITFATDASVPIAGTLGTARGRGAGLSA